VQKICHLQSPIASALGIVDLEVVDRQLGLLADYSQGPSSIDTYAARTPTLSAVPGIVAGPYRTVRTVMGAGKLLLDQWPKRR
jgi:hypothetical protein